MLNRSDSGCHQFVQSSRFVVIVVGGIFLILVAAGCGGPNPSLELALLHAPIIYQDTDDTDPAADYITRFNYDGNMVAADNWDNFDDFRDDLPGVVYYSVVEAPSYWFIVYAFFHPRDWSDTRFEDEHENDLEGILAIVEREDSDPDRGQLVGVITVFHTDFFSYTPPGSPLGDGEEDIDGPTESDDWNEAPHLRLTIEAKGHGVKAWPFAGDFSGQRDRDGVIYFPAQSVTAAEATPESGNDREASYTLVSLFSTLWPEQLNEATDGDAVADTYETWGNFDGNGSGTCGDPWFIDCDDDAANLPWRWDDDDDGVWEGVGPFRFLIDPIPAGLLALDPWLIADRYFSGLPSPSRYTDNRYLEDLKRHGFGSDNLPGGWPDGLDLDDLLSRAPEE